MTATLAAWTSGDTWLRALREQLRRNRDILADALRDLAIIRWTPPSATHLAWLDLRDSAAAVDPRKFFIAKAGVHLQAGSAFGVDFNGFARLNVGTETDKHALPHSRGAFDTGQQIMTEQQLLSLDRFDEVLARRRDLRLRVVCPSQEFSPEEMAYGAGRWFSCVRGLWESLSVAQDPHLALIMLQAPPVPTPVLRYLFSLLPGGPEETADCWDRHSLVGLPDQRSCHLSQKVLQAPVALARLGWTLQQARRRGQTVEGLSCLTSSDQVARLADVLGLPLLATPPHTLYWGSKAGARQIFRRAGVPHPPGSYVADRNISVLCRTVSGLAGDHGVGQWLLKVMDGLGQVMGTRSST